MKPKKINRMGMSLDEWTHESCIATIGEGENWATIYSITSKEKGRGHGTELLIEMKKYYETQGKTFGSSVALSGAMKHLLTKLNIPEYAQ